MQKSFEGKLGPGNPRRTADQPAFDHPYVAAVLDDLRKDWPYIARRAEHPLTEFFLLRDRRKGFRLRQIPVGLFVWSAAWIVAMVALVTFYNYVGGVIALALCALERVLHKKIFKKYVREIAEPIDVIEETDRGKMEHLYLAPFHFRDLLGACAVYYYRFWLRYVAGLLFVIAAVLCFFLGLVKYCADMGSGFHKYAFPLYFGMIVIFIRIAWLVCSPRFIMAVGIRNLFAKLMEKSNQIVALREGVVMERFWIGLAISPLISLFVLFGTRSFWAWIVALVLACLYQCRLAGQNLDSLIRENFSRYESDGERLYADLIKTEKKSDQNMIVFRGHH